MVCLFVFFKVNLVLKFISPENILFKILATTDILNLLRPKWILGLGCNAKRLIFNNLFGIYSKHLTTGHNKILN